MAVASSSPLLLNSSLLPSSSSHLQNRALHLSQSCSRFGLRTKTRTRPIHVSNTIADADVRNEDIVIVGAGIAGLATAVSLQRSDY